MADLNGTMMQFFHAYRFHDSMDWTSLSEQVKHLAEVGITALWLPTAAQFEVGCVIEAHTAIQALQAADLHLYVSVTGSADEADPDAPQNLVWKDAAVQGFCVELVQQINAEGFQQWLHRICTDLQAPLFLAGEYWTEQVEVLHQYIRTTKGRLSLFDVPLHYNFYRASRSGGYYDMSKLLKGTLMQQQPALAVTFVENHHSQPLQPFESVVEPWFKPLAYAVILLRREGYPCLFHADYYGAHYCDQGKDGRIHEIWMDCHRWLLDKFLYARQHYAYGKQADYFDHDSVVGWTRLGNAEHPKTMAVLMSDGWGGSKWMEVGRPNAAFYDLTEHIQEPVYTNQSGWGEFHCRGGSVSVWLEE